MIEQSRSVNKKLLPEVNKKVSLRKHGYKLNKSNISRKRSLSRASNRYGTLSVLRRVNLIRNYSKKNKDKYKTLSNDVEYMKKKYADEKEKGNINRGSNTRKKYKTKQSKTNIKTLSKK